jgi:hypothetical protein
MNKRVIELYRSCKTKEALASQDEYKTSDVLIGSEVSKFSELMVAEVISVLQKRYMGDLNREDQEVMRCIEDVKKHFGVENE